MLRRTYPRPRPEAAAEFRHVVPRTEAAALAGASEGTAAQK